MELRARTAADLVSAAVALRATYDADTGPGRYPSRWHEDAGGWLSPADAVGAWVVVEGDRVLGHVVLQQRGEVLHVGRLFVDPADRGRGVADLLLAEVERVAAGRPLELEVHAAATAAITRYERRGWRRTGSGPASWAKPDGTRPEAHWYAFDPR